MSGKESSGGSVMGIYSWVGAWNLNRQRHCSGQVLRGGQTVGEEGEDWGLFLGRRRLLSMVF